MIFRWNTAPHSTAGTSQLCDVNGHRLYVKRVSKGSTWFVGTIDGVRCWKDRASIDEGKRQVEMAFALMFPQAADEAYSKQLGAPDVAPL